MLSLRASFSVPMIRSKLVLNTDGNCVAGILTRIPAVSVSLSVRRKATGGDFGEVNFCVGDVVKVVREDIVGDDRHDFDEFGIGDPGLAGVAMSSSVSCPRLATIWRAA